jgi:hypothetical protein
VRDDQIIQRQNNDAKRISMIYRQMVFIDTRLQAMESVYKKLTRWERLFASSEDIMKKVDQLHLEVMKMHDDQLKDAQEVAKMERSKPKLTLVGANGEIHG